MTGDQVPATQCETWIEFLAPSGHKHLETKPAVEALCQFDYVTLPLNLKTKQNPLFFCKPSN